MFNNIFKQPKFFEKTWQILLNMKTVFETWLSFIRKKK